MRREIVELDVVEGGTVKLDVVMFNVVELVAAEPFCCSPCLMMLAHMA